MRRLAAALSPVLALCPLILCGQAAGPSPFGERVDVNIVNVDVFVSDRDGRPVSGLRRGDFEVREDGKAMAITNFDAFRPSSEPAAGAGGANPRPEPAAESAAAPAADPLHLVIYVDNGFLLPAHRNRVLQQLRDFLGRLRPEDEVMLATADPGLRIRLPFTRDRAALARTVDEIEKLAALGMSNASAKRQTIDAIFTLREANRKIDGPCAVDIAQPAHSYAEATRAEVLRSLGTMTLLVSSLSGIPGRKALLLVSDGMPVTPGEEVFQIIGELCGGSTSGLTDVDAGSTGFGGATSSYDSRQAALDAQRYSAVSAFEKLTSHANAQRVTLYTLQASGLQGSSSSAAEFGLNERVLQLPSVALVETTNLQNSLSVLADDTGGRAILNANDLRSDLARMQEDFATYYSLAYAPAHTGDGREHRIEVRVKRPGLRVRSRRGYRDKPPLERMADRTLASLFYGIEDNPLQIEVKIGDSAPVDSKSWMVPIRLRIPLFKVTMLTTETSFEGKLRVLVATDDASGRRSPLRQIQVPISIPRAKALVALGQYYVYEVKLTLESGEQHVAVAVRDEPTATTSFLARTLQVGTGL